MTLNRAASRNGIQAQSQADVFGVVCSVGCAIHCAATPILLSALPSISSVQWLADPLFHQVVAVVCAVLVVRAILPGWRLHRSRSVAMFAISGVSLLFAAAFILPDKCCDQHHVPTANLRQSSNLELAFSDTLGSSNAVPWMAVHLVSHPSVKADAREILTDRLPDSDHAHGARNCDFSQTLPSESCEDRAESPYYPTTRVVKHASTWSHPLLSEGNLHATLGPVVAEKLLTAQPFLSPFGGVLLIVAHLLNIQLRCCGSAACRIKKPIHE